MRVKTFSSKGPEHGFGALKWQLAFHGADIDARTKAAISFVAGGASESLCVQFSPDQPDRLQVNARRTSLLDITKKMSVKNDVVFEATSLGTVEVLFLLRAAKAAKLRSVDCVYVEPHEYAKDAYLDTSWSRDYSLSKSRRLEGVRGFAHRLSDIPAKDARLVVFLGYEAARLAQACEQEEAIVSWNKYAVFGVPGYAPGWEMNSIANNVDALERYKFESVRYCAASSVCGAFDLLKSIHAEGRSDHACTVVAPFGTKPHGIASAMFLVENSEYQASSLIYDHPEKSRNRTSLVRRWHRYRIEL